MRADQTAGNQRVRQDISHQRSIFQNKQEVKVLTWLKTTQESNKEQGTKANLKGTDK